MLADILPTGYEVGVLNGQVRPGDVVAVVGAGPIGLAAIMGARLYSPSHVVAIDMADSRLEAAKQFGADVTVNNDREDPVEVVAGLTGGLGADVAIEAVGVPATFELAAALIRPGGHVANIGVHGEPATLHLEDLWIKNVTITTGLVDTYSTPTPAEAHQRQPGRRRALRHPPLPPRPVRWRPTTSSPGPATPAPSRWSSAAEESAAMPDIVACTSCGKRNRVPVAASGTPRCAACGADLPWLVEAGEDASTRPSGPGRPCSSTCGPRGAGRAGWSPPVSSGRPSSWPGA